MSADPVTTANALRGELAERGIGDTFLHTRPDTAMLSIWADLAVWSHPLGWYFWWTGRRRHGRDVYAIHPADDAPGAARRIQRRYQELRPGAPA